MKKFAVIDIGSNSVRLMFVADGTVLYKQIQTTRLGEGIAHKKVLQEGAIERTAQAVAAFYRQAKAEEAEEVFAFATAAVRAAENRTAFLERVQALCGLRVEVIAGEEEAEIGLLGALGDADGAVVDIGGASTEIVVKSQGEILYKKSINVGVVRLKDKCGREISALEKEAVAAAKEFGTVPCKPLYAIGGTATTLAAQYLGITEYDSNRVTGTKITKAQMREQVEKFAALSVEETESLPCMPKGRADVLLGGVVLLFTLMDKLGFDEVTVSDRDNLEGYAIKRLLIK